MENSWVPSCRSVFQMQSKPPHPKMINYMHWSQQWAALREKKGSSHIRLDFYGWITSVSEYCFNPGALQITAWGKCSHRESVLNFWTPLLRTSKKRIWSGESMNEFAQVNEFHQGFSGKEKGRFPVGRVHVFADGCLELLGCRPSITNRNRGLYICPVLLPSKSLLPLYSVYCQNCRNILIRYSHKVRGRAKLAQFSTVLE